MDKEWRSGNGWGCVEKQSWLPNRATPNWREPGFTQEGLQEAKLRVRQQCREERKERKVRWCQRVDSRAGKWDVSARDEREGGQSGGWWVGGERERAACLAFSLNSEFCNFQSQRLRDLTSATQGVCSHRQCIHKEKKRGRHCVQRWLEALHLLTEKLQQMDTKFPQTGQNRRTGR